LYIGCANEDREENRLMTRPPVPPFDEETARQKVKAAEDAWNLRNRDEFFEGREEIVAFLRRKWARELDYRLMRELWCYQGNRISVRFEYESHDEDGQWWLRHPYHPFATRLCVVASTGQEPEAELALA
jgi:nuclear transport factor 2 (NTF2) superfamily protein